MNLIIDQGNSVCKVAVVDGGEFIAHYSFPQVSLREAGSILSDYPDLKAAIYSSVAGVDKLLLSLLAERIPTVLRVDEYIDVPVRVRYDRKGLGSDRLAAVVGASALAPQGVSLLVVDLGTAITFEQITVYLCFTISSHQCVTLARLPLRLFPRACYMASSTRSKDI